MIDAVLRILLRCPHRHLTRPFTPVEQGLPRSSTYVVCLDCGTRLGYDWHRMRLGSRRASTQSAGQVELVQRKTKSTIDASVSEAAKTVVERARA